MNHIYYLQTIKADDPFTLLTIVLALVIWKRIHNVTHNMKRKVLMKRMKIHTKCRGKTNLCNAFIVVFVIHNRSISDSEFSEYTRLNQSGCLISLSNYVSIYVRVIGIIRSKFQNLQGRSTLITSVIIDHYLSICVRVIGFQSHP